MKHIKLFEEDVDDLIGDLDSIGFTKSIGYMYLSNKGEFPIAFLVKAKTEERCVKMVAALATKDYFLTPPSIKYSTSAVPYASPVFSSDFKTVPEALEFFFEQGYIPDAGYYGVFKGRDASEAVITFEDTYTINAKAFVDLAYEHFENADQVFKDYTADTKKTWTPKDLGL